MSDARSLYDALLDAWNRRNPDQFAELFENEAIVIGYDGSVMNGPDDIRKQLGEIFGSHPTARYVAKVREVLTLANGVTLLRAVAGMIPPDSSELNPKVNAHQTLVSREKIVLFQNTPAQFHGRPDLAEALTNELRELLP